MQKEVQNTFKENTQDKYIYTFTHMTKKTH